MKYYSKPLKVSEPDGQRVYARVKRIGNNVDIEVSFLEIVKEDDPPFATNGVIHFTCLQKQYAEVITVLTQYLEDLFLKGMANEDIHTLLGTKPKSRRDSKLDTTVNVRQPKESAESKSERDTTSVHSGTGRDKQTERDREGNSTFKMDKSSDQESSRED